MTLALVHAVADALARCELTFVERRPIDLARARAQHRGYCELLARLGLSVRVLDTGDHADATFVEDCAVALDEVAIAGAMGVPSRAAEVERLLPLLAQHLPVLRLPPGATLEGGDVLRLHRTLFVGRSRRTNRAGHDALARLVQPLGYDVVPVPVHGCLHLKTAVTALADDLVLLNADWIDATPFAGLRRLPVAAGEPFAANALRLRDGVVMSASHPHSIARVRAFGIDVHEVAIDELEKAEAGVTCLSLLLPDRR